MRMGPSSAHDNKTVSSQALHVNRLAAIIEPATAAEAARWGDQLVRSSRQHGYSVIELISTFPWKFEGAREAFTCVDEFCDR